MRGVADDAAGRQASRRPACPRASPPRGHTVPAAPLRDEEFGVPGRDVAGRVERGAQVDQRRRPFRIPAVLVGARPLHAHRLADGLGEQRRIGGGVLVAVAAVAARAVDIDAAHVLERHAEHLRELLAQIMRRLRRRPGRQLAVLELGDRAGRPDRAVGVDGEIIGRAELLARRPPSRSAVSPTLLVTSSLAIFVPRTCSQSFFCSGSVSDFDHVALISRAARDRRPFGLRRRRRGNCLRAPP